MKSLEAEDFDNDQITDTHQRKDWTSEAFWRRQKIENQVLQIESPKLKKNDLKLNWKHKLKQVDNPSIGFLNISQRSKSVNLNKIKLTCAIPEVEEQNNQHKTERSHPRDNENIWKNIDVKINKSIMKQLNQLRTANENLIQENQLLRDKIEEKQEHNNLLKKMYKDNSNLEDLMDDTNKKLKSKLNMIESDFKENRISLKRLQTDNINLKEVIQSIESCYKEEITKLSEMIEIKQRIDNQLKQEKSGKSY